MMDTQVYKTIDGKRYNKFHDEIIDCKICSKPTTMTGTKLCNRCWNAQGIFNKTEKETLLHALNKTYGKLVLDERTVKILNLIKKVEKL